LPGVLREVLRGRPFGRDETNLECSESSSVGAGSEEFLMKVSELISYLQNVHCPKEAKVIIADERSLEEIQKKFLAPQVVWWGDDRDTVYLGEL